MIKRDTFIKEINSYMNIKDFHDTGINGLQVEGNEIIKTICFGVTASFELFIKAKELKADMIIVHHGLLWDKTFALTGHNRLRFKILLENNINLAAYHLPLDSHYETGNNSQLLKLFNIKELYPFGKYKKSYIGYKAELIKVSDIDSISKKLTQTIGKTSQIFRFGKKDIKSIGIVSGGAPDIIFQAIEEDLDLFITGEATEYVHEVSKENKINFIAAGHYNSEKLGIIALKEYIGSKFDVETHFIDIPNPV